MLKSDTEIIGRGTHVTSNKINSNSSEWGLPTWTTPNSLNTFISGIIIIKMKNMVYEYMYLSVINHENKFPGST
jgi:hypothetical protein